MIVLDKDHMTLLERAGSVEASRIRTRLDDVPPDERTTTIITYEEQTRGWLKYVAKAHTVVELIRAYAKLSRHVDVYRRIRVLEFDERAGATLDRLQKSRVRVKAMDLRIAAIVLAQDATLLSRNLIDFQRVPGLKVQDWTV